MTFNLQNQRTIQRNSLDTPDESIVTNFLDNKLGEDPVFRASIKDAVLAAISKDPKKNQVLKLYGEEDIIDIITQLTAAADLALRLQNRGQYDHNIATLESAKTHTSHIPLKGAVETTRIALYLLSSITTYLGMRQYTGQASAMIFDKMNLESDPMMQLLITEISRSHLVLLASFINKIKDLAKHDI